MAFRLTLFSHSAHICVPHLPLASTFSATQHFFGPRYACKHKRPDGIEPTNEGFAGPYPANGYWAHFSRRPFPPVSNHNQPEGRWLKSARTVAASHIHLNSSNCKKFAVELSFVIQGHSPRGMPSLRSTGAVGFEPTVAHRHNDFQNRHHKPLGHTPNNLDSSILAGLEPTVVCIQANVLSVRLQK